MRSLGVASERRSHAGSEDDENGETRLLGTAAVSGVCSAELVSSKIERAGG